MLIIGCDFRAGGSPLVSEKFSRVGRVVQRIGDKSKIEAPGAAPCDFKGDDMRQAPPCGAMYARADRA